MDSANNKDYVKELAKIFSLGVRDIPEFIKQNADNILKVVVEACIDVLIIVIGWTDPFPRTGRQTKRSLIQLITTHGGTNEFGSDFVFSFRNSRQLGDCMLTLPDWSRHDRNNLNVAIAIE